MTDFSTAKLLEFLDYLQSKGLMNRATAQARKAATNTFLSILSEEEAADLRKIDMNDVALRFSNLKGSQFKPESIKVYKSRVASALEDLKKYRANPLTFKPSTAPSKTPLGSKEGKDTTKSALKHDDQIYDIQDMSFPVPIRPNVVVRIFGLPSDLTKAEAAKIGNVVLALASGSEG